MIKSGIDQDALVTLFSEASAKQGDSLRQAVSAATLKALQSRELTIENIRKVVKSVTQAASTGAAQNALPNVDVEGMLEKALAGIDSALLQAVEANRKALQQFVDQGTGLQEKQLKTALANVEKMEDVFFDAVRKAVPSGGPLQGAWEQALSAMQMKGSETGAQATRTVEELTQRAQTALRDSRATSMRAAQAMLDSYAAMVSGVLLGMSEGLQAGRAGATQQSSAEPAAGDESDGGGDAKPARGRKR
ncbi:DUF6781 family protein [Piscinibacter koreensis]|uniref:DUF6781 family protein n=1 Tax=Piscinibacter koreensis TaxID=2742824 RepID=UPI001FE4E92F|nr:DUF6781 family protein [Schlegelella koreensis]